MLRNDKGQITNWHLESSPHGPRALESSIRGIRWDVKYIDASGGHIQAKIWLKPKTHCYAMADFKWTFSKDVSNVAQDESININFSVSAQPSPDCPVNDDPIMEASAMGSISSLREEIMGTISDKGRELFSYGGSSRGGNLDRISTANRSVNNVLIVVKDRSPTGEDLDARDGGFGFWLNWRGLSYDVY